MPPSFKIIYLNKMKEIMSQVLHFVVGNFRRLFFLQVSSLGTKAADLTTAIQAVDLQSDNYFGTNARASAATTFECSESKFTDGGCPNIYGHTAKYTLDGTKCGMFVLVSEN